MRLDVPPIGANVAEQSPPSTSPPPEPRASAPPDTSLHGPQDREPQEIARSLLDDIQLLFRKHIELAKQELQEAAEARMVAAIAGVTAGVASLFALGFLAAAGAHALENVVAAWLARVIVAVVFLVVAGIGGAVARSRMMSPPLAPERTRRTVEEDVGWVRARMRR